MCEIYPEYVFGLDIYSLAHVLTEYSPCCVNCPMLQVDFEVSFSSSICDDAGMTSRMCLLCIGHVFPRGLVPSNVVLYGL